MYVCFPNLIFKEGNALKTLVFSLLLMSELDSGLILLTDKYSAAAEKVDAIGSRVRLGTEEEFPEVVCRDLERLRRRVCMNAGSKYPLEVILVRTIEGHMRTGDGLFYGRIYPKKGKSDIVNALGMDNDIVIEQGQSFVNRLERYVGNALEFALGQRKKSRRGTTKLKVKSTPVLDLPFLEGTVDPLHVLKGIVTNGLVDSHEYREKTRNHPQYEKTILGRNFELGSGEQLFVNTSAYEARFGDIRYLSVVDHDETMITALTELGIVSREPLKKFDPHYVKRAIGWGTSDDLAIITTGETYRSEGKLASLSAMKGFFLGDAADTMDDYLSYPVVGGWDEMLARYIQGVWETETETKVPLVSDETILRTIYFSAKDNDLPVLSSSSHRWLSQVQGNSRDAMSMFESHANFVMGGRLMDGQVGYGGLKGKQFYHAARQRRKHLRQELKAA
jgi:hypothetical protein